MFDLLLMLWHMLQLKDDTARCEEDEAEKKIKLKAMREHHHKWEDTREGRVGTWRDFVKGKKTRVCTILTVVQHDTAVLCHALQTWKQCLGVNKEHQHECFSLCDGNISMLFQLTGWRLNVLCDLITCLLSQCSCFWCAGQPRRLSLCR